MEKRSAVLGAVGTLATLGIAFGGFAIANAENQPAPAPAPVTAVTATATPTPETVVTTAAPEPSAAPVAEPVATVAPAPVVVEPAPVVVAPEPVYVAPATAATLPNGMTTVQVPGGPPPVKWDTSSTPAPGTTNIVNPSLQDVGLTPKEPTAGK